MDPEEIRRQLKLAMDFMEATPVPENYSYSPEFWAMDQVGEMPAYPEEYECRDWEVMNRPIAEIWRGWIQELDYDTRHGRPEHVPYVQKAREFEAQILGLLEE